ncbi:TetR/AcrR family transcriptional regulator [Actinocrispum wychmicini]|uniref:TetR/AcrR family transcriptional regulator n=1 Tax=Actinocrispum wychmicini TaxID=1213861 RepID=UPI0014044CCE|nr:TetR/AcrR family transcriptional regulator [Actinocrispum wychmicini]
MSPSAKGHPGDTRNLPELLPPRATMTGTVRRLLETAVVQFAERGYYGVSVRDITAQIGIRPSSMYAHFSAKEDILAELVRLGLDEHRHRLQQAVLDAGSGATDQLRALVRAHVRMYATYPLLMRVCDRQEHALPESELKATLETHVDAASIGMEVLQRGVAAGEFVDSDPFLTTAAIAAMGIRVAEWYGASHFHQLQVPDMPDAGVTRERYTIDEIADTYADFAVRMVSPSG